MRRKTPEPETPTAQEAVEALEKLRSAKKEYLEVSDALRGETRAEGRIDADIDKTLAEQRKLAGRLSELKREKELAGQWERGSIDALEQARWDQLWAAYEEVEELGM